MKLMLYSYCIIFHLNPMEAKDTPISTIIEMLEIHGEVEQFKSEEIASEVKRNSGKFGR